ncbi:hypothetical protein PIB30_089825 [Stylosanthes scabra]|uniref:Uncharacterized protein n=1 Tax=Stylosanthes scabra TaxID=79078 RepID=A0ABU6ZST0_9FABA|nr:hypothetical protein [Stylosanthes scabra]
MVVKRLSPSRPSSLLILLVNNILRLLVVSLIRYLFVMDSHPTTAAGIPLDLMKPMVLYPKRMSTFFSF